MSTATVDDTSTPGPDETIRRTVRALRSAYDVDARVLAHHLGISRNSLYNRLNGTAPWLAAEIVGLAHFFGCDVVDFYTGNVRIEGGATAPVHLRDTVHIRECERGFLTDIPQLSALHPRHLPCSVVSVAIPDRPAAVVTQRVNTDQTHHLPRVA